MSRACSHAIWGNVWMGSLSRASSWHAKAAVKQGCIRPLVTLSTTRRTACKSQGGPVPGGSESSNEDADGNEDVQEALLESLRLGIKRQQTKDEVEESFQQEVQKLREIADQAKEELEAVAKLNSMRQDLAFGSTLADLLQDVDELQEELRKSRQQTEADQREFEQWERDTNIARSQGLFFKSLYPVSSKLGARAGSEASSSGSGMDVQLRAQAAASTRQSIQEVTKHELVSPWRLYLLSYMILVLLLFSTYDLLSSHPSPMQDGLLAFLAALMGVAAWNERQAVITLGSTAQQRAQQVTQPATQQGSDANATADTSPTPPGQDGEKSGSS